MHASLLLLAVGLGGCSLTQDGFEPYYANRQDPTVSSLSATSETGNLGGTQVTITGSGFGASVDDVMVLFGDENAELVSVTDGEIVLLVPRGPLTGGFVDVRVATATGNTVLADAYQYNIGDSLYDDQYGYIQVSNYWESCYGGLSSRLDDQYSGIGCDTFAWIGQTGLEGAATRLDFAYPRLHTNDIGMFIVGGSMEGGNEWTVQRPAAYPDTTIALEDLYRDIGEITLRNPTWEGRQWCGDLDDQAVYYYGGGAGAGDPIAVSESDIPTGRARGECGAEDGPDVYEMGELHFCDSPDAEGVRDRVYRPDWPVVENFFAADREGTVDDVEITIDAPDVGVEGLALGLPRSIIVNAVQGFDSLIEGEETPDLWGVSSLQGCFDDDRNGERLDDVAVEFTWEPARRNILTEGGAVLGSRNYVRATITQSGYNWFGLGGFPIRATISVPDRNDVDDEGFSHLEIPASVLYQFPTAVQPSGGFGGANLYDSMGSWGFLVVSVERVTDYLIQTDGEPVVFSYATGDFGLIDWTNPTDAGECDNCLDDDRDGWSDDLDPDCAGAGYEETSTTTDNACNNGLDDDGDGDVDSDDGDCEDGADDDEGDCQNNEDDDEDGWSDENDPDCATGARELGVGTDGCNNGVDDDGDGDTDAEDSDCTLATDTESLAVDLCADGTDNDADGWSDADDPDCTSGSAEVGVGTDACNNGLDDDGDEAIDADDPDCTAAADAEGVSVDACADGVDNDSDTWTDAEDPDCISGTDEIGIGTDACNDGVDNDGDSAIDNDDPECTDAIDADESA